MMQEVRDMDKKYDCDLCRLMVLDLIESIEDEWRRRESKHAEEKR